MLPYTTIEHIQNIKAFIEALNLELEKASNQGLIFDVTGPKLGNQSTDNLIKIDMYINLTLINNQ